MTKLKDVEVGSPPVVLLESSRPLVESHDLLPRRTGVLPANLYQTRHYQENWLTAFSL